MCGSEGVGKSHLCSFLTDQDGFSFRQMHYSINGVELKIATAFDVKEKKTIRLLYWDLSGNRCQQDFEIYKEKTRAVFLIYNITDEESFQFCCDLYDNAVSKMPIKPKILLVGNKIDLESERRVPTDKAQAFADTNGINFAEVSLKTLSNVDNLHDMLMKSVSESVVVK